MNYSSRMKKLYLTVIFIMTLGFLFFISLSTPIIVNSTDFSMYNSGWNGCSNLAMKTYETGALVSLLTYNSSTLTPVQKSFISYELSPENTTLMSIGPRTPFSKEEAQYIDWLLDNGGLVFLADDFGTANSLLQQLNTTTRFSNNLLLDLAFEKNASFATLFHFPNTTHPLTENLSSILINYPSSLSVSKNDTILAYSSPLSWLDSTMNGKHDDNEQTGPFPLLAVIHYGKGQLIVCSDPSTFINSMNTYLDNSRFIDQVFTYVTSGKSSVIIDESHRDIAVPFTVAISLPQTIDTTLKISIVLLVIIVYVTVFTSIPKQIIHMLWMYLPLSKKQMESIGQASVIDQVLKDHPTWDRETLDTIVQRMKDV